MKWFRKWDEEINKTNEKKEGEAAQWDDSTT